MCLANVWRKDGELHFEVDFQLLGRMGLSRGQVFRSGYRERSGLETKSGTTIYMAVETPGGKKYPREGL